MSSFHEDTKFCPCCNQYGRYLASFDRSFCIECGSEMRLFSDDDWSAFKTRMEARKPKGGRPRKNARRRAAAASRAA